MATPILEERVKQAARDDAELFVDEFNEWLDPSATDWDATAWMEVRRQLGLSNVDAETLWPVYQAALVNETMRLVKV